MVTQTNCGGLMYDDTVMEVNASKQLTVKSEKLVKDIVPYVSVPTTYSALADARAIDVKLRDALIACGVMLADV